MGIFKRILNNLRLTDDKAWDRSLWQPAWAQTLAGENITEQSALTISSVYNAVELIAGTISTLPLNLIRRDAKKTLVEEKNPLQRVLHSEWNPFMTAKAGRECLMAHVLLWGNGYAEQVRNNRGELIQLWPITPDRVLKIHWIDDDLVYEIKMDDGKPVFLPRSRVLHVPNIGFNGIVGYSVIAMARQSLGLTKALETFGSEYFAQGTHPGVIVSHPGKLNPETHKNMRESLTATYSGLGKSHRLMLLEEGLKLEKLGIPPNDSQFLESRQHQVTDVARWFNLPPHKLKDLTRSSFSNIESEQISFVTDSLLPRLISLEQNLNMQLLTDTEKAKGIYCKHVVEGLMRGSAKDRGEYYRLLWNIGGISLNEIRGKEDMDPDPNPLADERFVPMNMVPLSKVGEVKNTQGNGQDGELIPAAKGGNGNDRVAKRTEADA